MISSTLHSKQVERPGCYSILNQLFPNYITAFIVFEFASAKTRHFCFISCCYWHQNVKPPGDKRDRLSCNHFQNPRGKEGSVQATDCPRTHLISGRTKRGNKMSTLTSQRPLATHLWSNKLGHWRLSLQGRTGAVDRPARRNVLPSWAW